MRDFTWLASNWRRSCVQQNLPMIETIANRLYNTTTVENVLCRLKITRMELVGWLSYRYITDKFCVYRWNVRKQVYVVM